MTPPIAEDLPYKGTTVEEKERLLDQVQTDAQVHLAAGRLKDSHLTRGSGYIDIVHTADSITDKLNPDQTAERERWRALRQTCVTQMADTVSFVESLSRGDWNPADYEVLGVMILLLESHRPERVQAAKELFMEGLHKAETAGNIVALGLLAGQLVRVAMITRDEQEVKNALRNLYEVLWMDDEEKTIEDKDGTRLWRAFAEGGKFLALLTAERSGLTNQVLKAKAI